VIDVVSKAFRTVRSEVASVSGKVAKLRNEADLTAEARERRVKVLTDAGRSEILDALTEAQRSLDLYDVQVAEAANAAYAKVPTNDVYIDKSRLSSDASAMLSRQSAQIRATEEISGLLLEQAADRAVDRALERDEAKSGVPLVKLLEGIPSTQPRKLWVYEETALQRVRLEGALPQRVLIEQAVSELRSQRLPVDVQELVDFQNLFGNVRPLLTALVGDVRDERFFDRKSQTLGLALLNVLGDQAVARKFGAVD